MSGGCWANSFPLFPHRGNGDGKDFLVLTGGAAGQGSGVPLSAGKTILRGHFLCFSSSQGTELRLTFKVMAASSFTLEASDDALVASVLTGSRSEQ